MKKLILLSLIILIIPTNTLAYSAPTDGMKLITDLPKVKVVDINNINNYEIYFEAQLINTNDLQAYAIDWLVKRQDTQYKCFSDLVFGALEGKLITHFSNNFVISQTPKTYLQTFGEQPYDAHIADKTLWITDDDRSDMPYLCYNARNTALAENINDGKDTLTLHMIQSKIMTLLLFDGDPPQVFKDLTINEASADSPAGSPILNIPINFYSFLIGIFVIGIVSRKVKKWKINY